MCRNVYDDSLNQISGTYLRWFVTPTEDTHKKARPSCCYFHYKSNVSGLYSGASVDATSQVRAFWEIIKCDVAVKFSGVTFILSSVKTCQLFPNFK